MLQRWALNLSGYQYKIQHRPGKDIAHADYLSRNAHHEDPQPSEDTSVLLSIPLPVSRNRLIEETRLAYGPVLAGLRRGWSNSARKRFPDLFAKWSDLLLQADGVINFRERVLVLRRAGSKFSIPRSSRTGQNDIISTAPLLVTDPRCGYRFLRQGLYSVPTLEALYISLMDPVADFVPADETDPRELLRSLP